MTIAFIQQIKDENTTLVYLFKEVKEMIKLTSDYTHNVNQVRRYDSKNARMDAWETSKFSREYDDYRYQVKNRMDYNIASTPNYGLDPSKETESFAYSPNINRKINPLISEPGQPPKTNFCNSEEPIARPKGYRVMKV